MEDHVPVITGNYLPFRLVVRDKSDDWSPTIDDINKRTYDYVKLNRASTLIDIGIAPFSLVICFDGTFALPAIEEFRNPDVALLEFNKVLSQLFMGGVYCEAMSPEDICFGMMTHTAYCKITSSSRGAVSNFHKAIRSKHAGELDVIRIFRPQTINVASIQSAIQLGRTRLSEIGPVSPETFLYGATFYARNQWSESLIHLWTTIEQVSESIWQEQVIKGPNVEGISGKKRKDFLDDARTWTVSAKFELMYQKNLLPQETYALLDDGRRARNRFAHSGIKPSKKTVSAVLNALFQLCSLKISNFSDVSRLSEIRDSVISQSKIFESWDRQGEPIEGVTHWLSMPPLPGDSHWGDEPYEIIEELQLKPIKHENA